MGRFALGVPGLWGFGVMGALFPEFSAPYISETIHRIAKRFWTCNNRILTSSITMRSLLGLGRCAPPGGKNFDAFLLFSFLSVTLFNDKTCKREIAIKPFKPKNYVDIAGSQKICSWISASNFVFTLLEAPSPSRTAECTDSDKIYLAVDHSFTLPCKIWPWWVNGDWHKSPSTLAKLVKFAILGPAGDTVAVTRSSSADNAICYLLPVLWVRSCFHMWMWMC